MTRRATFWTGAICLILLPLIASCGSQKEVPPPPPTAEETAAPADEGDRKTGADEEKAIDPDRAYPFETIHFEFDKYRLTLPAQKILNQHAEVLVRNPSWTAKVAGHCDERGTVEYNLALGEKRAQAAKEYLVRYGVAAANLSTVSYGKERPIDMGHNEAAWFKNRRSEFEVRR